tara:strand:+ start:71 stop:880 length:810 start_codon:yes stop_codon:yes gene_type:complete
MGKIEVPLDKMLSRLSIGFVALTLLIGIGAFVISQDQGVTADEGLLLSLSFATRIEADTLENSDSMSRTMFLILAFGGEVLAFYVFYVLIEFMISGEFNKKLGGVKNRSQMKNLKNHYIVCGGGRVGQHVAEKLKDDGKAVVVVDKDDLKVERLKNEGFHVILGESNSDSVLKKAGVAHAHALAAVVGDDGDNLLTILTAKELNPEIGVASRANDENIVSKLKHAGAEIVILPEVVGGVKLADAILGEIDHNHVIHHPENKPKRKHRIH